MSTTEVTTASNHELAVDEANLIAQLERHAQEEPTYHWVGKLLKFEKGDYRAIDDEGDETEVDLGTKLTVAIDTLTIGWEKWVDKRLVDQRTGLVIEGFSRPERDELGDMDETAWPIWGDKKSGVRRDPWQQVSRVVMYGKKGDEDSIFTFVTRSYGGIAAINKLRDKALRELRMRPKSYPIIELGAGEYMNKKHGTMVDIPKLKVVDWTDDRWTGAAIRSAA
jgi:hypothetical protein